MGPSGSCSPTAASAKPKRVERRACFWKYCEGHIAARRSERADDLTSDLLDLADKKPDLLNDFDIVNMVYSMALADHETTCNTIGNGMRALLTNATVAGLDRRPVADPERHRRDPCATTGRC